MDYAEYQDKPLQQSTLQKFIQSKNICELISDDQLSALGHEILHNFEIDSTTEERAEKKHKWEEGRKVVKQIIEMKTRPFIGKAANFKHPLLSTAAIQYNSHTFPQIFNDGIPVKAKINGIDPDNSKYEQVKPAVDTMNYQLSEEMDEWIPQTDKLTLLHSLYGVVYRKIYYSPLKRRNCAKLLTPDQFILPKGCEGTSDCNRSTEIFYMWPNDIESYVRMGLFKEQDYKLTGDDNTDIAFMGSRGQEEFLEHHCYFDLDKDGIAEPYIVTIHKSTGKIFRIIANFLEKDIVFNADNKVVHVSRLDHYVDYPFITGFDNSSLPTGFLDLLYPVNEAANGITNMMLDAGKLATSNSGFIGRDAKIGKGPIKLEVGKYTPVNALGGDIKKSLVQLNFPGPSPTLFQLLGLMLDTGKEIGNIRDVLTGSSNLATMQPGTMMALVEQGTKIYSAIFLRLHNSFKKEFKILKRLNATYLDADKYTEVLDVKVTKEIFEDKKYNFCPVANPKESVEAMKMAKAAYIGQFMADPYFNPMEVRRRMLDAASIDDIDKLLVEPSGEPSIQDQILLSQMKVQEFKLQLDIMKAEKEAEEKDSKIVKNKASAIKDLAQAEAEEVGSQLDMYKTQLEAINDEENNEQRVSSMEGA